MLSATRELIVHALKPSCHHYRHRDQQRKCKPRSTGYCSRRAPKVARRLTVVCRKLSAQRSLRCELRRPARIVAPNSKPRSPRHERPASQFPAVRDADPLADAVAVYAGALGWKLDAGKLLPWLALVPVLFLELGSALAVVVVCGVDHRDTQARVATGGVVSQSAAPELSQEAPRDVSRGTPAKRPKAKRKDCEPPSSGTGDDGPMRGLVAMLEPLRDGRVVDLSQRKLARALGVGKSSVNRILHELTVRGDLIVRDDGGRNSARPRGLVRRSWEVWMGGAYSEAPPILITTTGGGDNDARTPDDSSDGGTTEHGPPNSTRGLLPRVCQCPRQERPARTR